MLVRVDADRGAPSRPLFPPGIVRRTAWAAFRRTLPVTGPDDRRGGWVQTYSGERFWPMDPREEDVRIVDVAHQLSMRNRFSGACIVPYSVAQHAVLLSLAVPGGPAAEYAGLHHDDTEKGLPDVPSPMKPYIPFWKMLEGLHEAAIVTGAFRVDPAMLRAIKPYDKRIVMDEAAVVLHPSRHAWTNAPEPLGIEIEPWGPAEAEARYLERHFELSRKLGL